jgi:hypothetical protein
MIATIRRQVPLRRQRRLRAANLRPAREKRAKVWPGGKEPKKTSIHLVNRTAFAGVATRKSAIILTIKSDCQLSNPRIHKSEQTSASRFHHEVKLTSPADVDSELVKWLKDAYALSE